MLISLRPTRIFNPAFHPHRQRNRLQATLGRSADFGNGYTSDNRSRLSGRDCQFGPTDLGSRCVPERFFAADLSPAPCLRVSGVKSCPVAPDAGFRCVHKYIILSAAYACVCRSRRCDDHQAVVGGHPVAKSPGADFVVFGRQLAKQDQDKLSPCWIQRNAVPKRHNGSNYVACTHRISWENRALRRCSGDKTRVFCRGKLGPLRQRQNSGLASRNSRPIPFEVVAFFFGRRQKSHRKIASRSPGRDSILPQFSTDTVG